MSDLTQNHIERVALGEKNFSPSSPIGVFDSGLGGLSVVNEARRLMPNEHLIYYSDSRYAPYGVKDVDFVRARVDHIADFLYNMGIKALVVACNTATSLSCHILRQRYDIPIIGMEPALKVAVDAGKKKIAVLATSTTLKEQKFESLMNRMSGASVVYKFPAPSLVEEIEGRSYTRESIHRALDDAFSRRNGADFDAIVLGCTHFVLVREYIQDYFKGLDLYDGNRGTILNLERILASKSLLSMARSDFHPVQSSVLQEHGAVEIDGLTLLDSNPLNTRSLLNYVD